MATVFPYFAQPERFAVFLEAETACDCCQQVKSCLDAATFYGEETIDAICLDCLASGQLKSRDIFTCEGDTAELTRQIQVLHPDWSATEVQKEVQAKTETLEKTTPKVLSWQDWVWPCADGDYCTFVGYGSKALYNRLAKDGDGDWLFQRSFYHTVKGEADMDELWEDSMPIKEIKDQVASQDYETLFYVFQSRGGGDVVTVWDAM